MYDVIKYTKLESVISTCDFLLFNAFVLCIVNVFVMYAFLLLQFCLQTRCSTGIDQGKYYYKLSMVDV